MCKYRESESMRVYVLIFISCDNIRISVYQNVHRVSEYVQIYRESESVRVYVLIFVSCDNIRIPTYKKVYRVSEYVQIYRD